MSGIETSKPFLPVRSSLRVKTEKVDVLAQWKNVMAEDEVHPKIDKIHNSARNERSLDRCILDGQAIP